MIVRVPLRPIRQLGRVRPALAAERIELVPGVPVFELQLPDLREHAARVIWGVVHRAERVLTGVARAHSAPEARFVSGDEA